MFMHIAMNSVFGAYGTPEERAVTFSWLALGFSISNSIGPLVAGFAIEQLGHAERDADARRVSGRSRCVLLWRRKRPLPRPEHGRARKRARACSTCCASRSCATPSSSAWLLAMGWDLYTFLMPLYGARIGLAATTIGVIMSTFALATFAVRARHAARW